MITDRPDVVEVELSGNPCRSTRNSDYLGVEVTESGDLVKKLWVLM
jgi:hypothetical protein